MSDETHPMTLDIALLIAQDVAEDGDTYDDDDIRRALLRLARKVRGDQEGRRKVRDEYAFLATLESYQRGGS